MDDRQISTIGSPEFIDIHPYSPLISQCTIKVMYVGANRNRSYISKDVAIKMANTLPSSPIVGWWRDEKEDFGDHGNSMTIEGGEIKFDVKTVPYGFVAPDARVWFQKFLETDSEGNEVEREYMMTTGYLWTGQFKEAREALNGKGQSMELCSDDMYLDGSWAELDNSGLEFFIINDAVFSKLCILGDDVEPCFEGASVVGTEFSSQDQDFVATLFTMSKQLRETLSEGGLNMSKNTDVVEPAESELEEAVETEVPQVEESVEETVEVEEPAAEPEPQVEVTEPEPTPEPHEPVTLSSLGEQDFAKKDEDEKDEPSDDKDESGDGDGEKQPAKDEGAPAEDDEDKKKKPTQSSLDESIMSELEELRAFKLSIERERKQEVLDRYHMLADEDKADISAHLDEYSVEHVNELLAVAYVNKYVDFSTVDGRPQVEADEPVVAFSLEDTISNDGEAVDGLQSALREFMNR